MSEIKTPKMSDYYRSISKCPECQGLGYKEYEAGLIRMVCWACNGTGIVGESLRLDAVNEPSYLILPEPIEGKTLDETADIARKIIKEAGETSEPDISRIKSDNQSTRVKNTRKPKL